jgi:hypothetical protein
MKSNRLVVIIFSSMMLLLTIACGFNFSTAKVSDAYMARDLDGELEKVQSYGQDEIFLCIVDLANAPDDTVVSAAWYAVDAQDVDPNFLIDEASITGDASPIYFDLSNNGLWPIGTYRVDISLNEEFVQSVTFQVQ